MKINLFIAHIPNATKERRAEYDYCLKKNRANKYIDDIVILKTSAPTMYSDFFELTKDCPNDVNVLANSDIYFDESIDWCRNIRGTDIYAISRWSLDKDGNLSLDANNNHADKLSRSQDVWACKGSPLRVFGDISMGVNGCDNRIAYEFSAAGYNVINPCLDIKCYHKHNKRIPRDGLIKNPYKSVSIVRLTPPISVDTSKLKKIISFSLYGKKDFYLQSAIRCVETGKEKYSDWEWRFYVGDSVPTKTVEALHNLGCSIIHISGEPENSLSMFWRFYALEDSDIFISRDCDSPILWREKAAVEEWINSDKKLHIMRDHEYHRHIMLGGMWGLKGKIPSIKKMIQKCNHKPSGLIGKPDLYGSDQDFLQKEIWPRYKDSYMLHVGHPNCIYQGDEVLFFPTARKEREFVGIPYNWHEFSEEENKKGVNVP